MFILTLIRPPPTRLSSYVVYLYLCRTLTLNQIIVIIIIIGRRKVILGWAQKYAADRFVISKTWRERERMERMMMLIQGYINTWIGESNAKHMWWTALNSTEQGREEHSEMMNWRWVLSWVEHGSRIIRVGSVSVCPHSSQLLSLLLLPVLLLGHNTREI